MFYWDSNSYIRFLHSDFLTRPHEKRRKPHLLTEIKTSSGRLFFVLFNQLNSVTNAILQLNVGSFC